MKGTQCLTAFFPFPSIIPSPIDSLQPGLNGLETQQVKKYHLSLFSSRTVNWDSKRLDFLSGWILGDFLSTKSCSKAQLQSLLHFDVLLDSPNVELIAPFAVFIVLLFISITKASKGIPSLWVKAADGTVRKADGWMGEDPEEGKQLLKGAVAGRS